MEQYAINKLGGITQQQLLQRSRTKPESHNLKKGDQNRYFCLLKEGIQTHQWTQKESPSLSNLTFLSHTEARRVHRASDPCQWLPHRTLIETLEMVKEDDDTDCPIQHSPRSPSTLFEPRLHPLQSKGVP